MARYLQTFVKVFSREEYRNDFLNGKLYMNTIEYFKNYEEETNSNIADKNEALIAWLQPNDITVQLQLGDTEIELSSKDFAAPLTVSISAHNNCNIFCLTYLHGKDIDIDSPFDSATLKILQNCFILDERISELGEFAVLIQPEIFLERVRKSVDDLVNNKAIVAGISKPVTYYDEEKSSLSLNLHTEAVFHKQSKYSHQSEFRICIFRNNAPGEPFILNVGNLRDISQVIDTKDLNNFFNFQLDKVVELDS